MTTETRELLELAAKAAGIPFVWDFWNSPEYGDTPVARAPRDQLSWNPLTDDGDALRLAVKLRLQLSIHERGCIVSLGEGEDVLGECGISVTGDINAATRLAIVRAAAEIGRAMP